MSAQLHYTVSSHGFTPLEHAILAEYFSVTPLMPAQRIDIWDDLEQARWSPSDDPAEGIRLRPDCNGYTEFHALDDAVARICLEKIQHRLPQWLGGTLGGEIITGRKIHNATHRSVVLFPQFLFQINWADSGPGFSWPVAYHVTYVPEYHRYVVTESADSPDMRGYCDIALGHFDGDKSIIEGCHEVVMGEWWHASGEYEQERWVSFLNSGMIDSGTAESWADEVWKEEEDEDELD